MREGAGSGIVSVGRQVLSQGHLLGRLLGFALLKRAGFGSTVFSFVRMKKRHEQCISCLFFVLMAAGLGCGTSRAEEGGGSAGVILHEEMNVGQRSAVPMTSIRVPRASGAPMGDRLLSGREAAVPMQARPSENLLDSMDVYALSPDARRLALPRMVSREFIRQARSGRIRMPAPAEWQAIIQRASKRYGLPPDLVAAVIRVESNFDVEAESPKGAQGLMQLMPGTQAYLGVQDPFDPEANVDAGSRYLREQLDRFGSTELALAAYNAGPGNVEKFGGLPPFAETQAYVRRVMQELH